jgi:hypothetical protein
VTSQELVERTAAELESRERVHVRLREMFETIPEAGDNVVEDMLVQLAGISELEQIDSLWNSNGLGNYAGWVLELQALKKLPSDLDDSCGWFTAVQAVVCETGEAVTITTSAALVMVQLIVLHGKNWFPVKVIPRFSERPTKRGYHPMHLELYRGGPLSPAPQGPPGARARQIMDNVKAKRAAREQADAQAGDALRERRVAMAEEEPGF